MGKKIGDGIFVVTIAKNMLKKGINMFIFLPIIKKIQKKYIFYTKVCHNALLCNIV